MRRLMGRFALSFMMVIAAMSTFATTHAVATTAKGVGMSGNPNATSMPKTVPSLGQLGPLTDLIIQRLAISDQVAASKFGTGQSIDDPAREQQELASVRQNAVSLGIDPNGTVNFFEQQIAASKLVQRGLFDRWTAHPELAPTTRPDLTQIRDQLDQITDDLIQQLVTQQYLLTSGLECQVELDLASATGAALNQLDSLHRRALSTAQSSTCFTPGQ